MANPFKDWTPEMLAAHNIRIVERRRKPANDHENNTAGTQPDQPQRLVREEPLGKVAIQKTHAAPVHRGPAQSGDGRTGKAAVPELQTQTRKAILVTDYRRKLIDEDNLSAKKEIDCLRYARLIPDDRPQDVKLFVRQKRTTIQSEIGTEIELFPIAPNWTEEGLFKFTALMTRVLTNDLSALDELRKMMAPIHEQ